MTTHLEPAPARLRRPPHVVAQPRHRLGVVAAVDLTAAGVVRATGAGGFRTEGLDVMVPLGLTVLVLLYVLLAIGEDVGWRACW